MKLKITALEVKDTVSKFDSNKPQKVVTFSDENGRKISMWLDVPLYKQEEWKVGGSTPDLDVYQKGQYWNAKLSGTGKSFSSAQTTQGIAQVLALCTEMNDRLKNIEGKVLPVAVNSTHPFES